MTNLGSVQTMLENHIGCKTTNNAIWLSLLRVRFSRRITDNIINRMTSTLPVNGQYIASSGA